VDVGAVAKQFGGGGHKNASGCTVTGTFSAVRADLAARIAAEIEQAVGAGA
jgi:phosphoesterase RecJ-like protein